MKYRLLLIILGTQIFSEAQQIRIWGNDAMQATVKEWTRAYAARVPSTHFDVRLLGTGTGMAGLYTGTADIAFMGREATAKEIMAFEWVFKYKPLAIEILTGSLAEPGKSPALAILVNTDNPVKSLTIGQLESIFACSQNPARTWGDLGLTGDWKNRPVRIKMPDAESNSSLFFNSVVMKGSRKWNWDLIDEFPADNNQRLMDAVAADREAIGIAPLSSGNPRVRVIPIAAIPLTRQTLIDRTYPLSHPVFAYVNRPPGQPLNASVRRFLEFILSAESFRIAEKFGYLALSPAAQQAQIRRLVE